jgi:hypothetical protein
MLLFTRKPKPRLKPDEVAMDDAAYACETQDDIYTKIKSYTSELLASDGQLRLLSTDELHDALFEFVDKEDKGAIERAVEEKLRRTRQLLCESRADGADIGTDRKANVAWAEQLLSEHSAKALAERAAAPAASGAGTSSGAVPHPQGQGQPAAVGASHSHLLDVDSDDEAAPPPRPLCRGARGRGGAAGRAGRARGAAERGRVGRGGRGRGATAAARADEMDDSVPSRESSPPPGKKLVLPPPSTSRAAPKRRAATTAQPSFATYAEQTDDEDSDKDFGDSAMKSSSSRRSFAGKRRMK